MTAGAATAMVLWILFFSEASLSLAHLSWHFQFERALREKGDVKLGSLVDFKWDKIYLLEPYAVIDAEEAAKLFPTESHPAPYYEADKAYWTIFYRRPGEAPFAVSIKTADWYLRNQTRDTTTDANATLRVVAGNTTEATYCVLPFRRCLALDDTQSKVPIFPNR
jgi:hypothetical protein